jgi:nicotinamidase-related amidase
MELLIAFDQCGGLAKLAKFLSKDPSVVSRNLQRLAEAAPVIVKVEGRWQISPLGREIGAKAASFRDDLCEIIGEYQGVPSRERISLDRSALVVVNAQKGLSLNASEGRSNLDAEANIFNLLTKYRSHRLPVVHVRHISKSASSPFFAGNPGAQFIDGLGPEGEEEVVDKHKSSGFAETLLLEILNSKKIDTVVIAGFTANECIDATARQAGDLGYTSIVAGDATATFDMRGPDGSLHLAERVHALTMANLHAHFAMVVTTAEILQFIGS